MAKFRDSISQFDNTTFFTDAGIETVLIFHEDLDLPEFAAFPLIQHEQGRQVLERYFRDCAAIALEHKMGFVFEAPTWRASQVWGDKLGYDAASMAQVNTQAIEFLAAIREDLESEGTPMPISGCFGSSCDGYNPVNLMSVDEAKAYHQVQMDTFAQSQADMVTAMTMAYVEEATGIALAAKEANMPVVIAFTVETDGKLPSGQPLGEAIQQVDEATEGYPQYYMINCAHPTHFDFMLKDAGDWSERIHGIRANASCMSHEELDNAEELDDGNPTELGQQYKALRDLLPNLRVMGGCCGTDKRHLEAIAKAF